MNQRNIIIGLAALVVMLVVLVFVVKKNATNQAQEHVKKTLEKSNYQMAQVKDNIENNNMLWFLIDSIWKSQDKSVAFVKRLASAQKLPRCKGKPCAGDDARLNTQVTSNAQERSIKVGWSKYSFKVIYDQKDKFVTIDTNDLLGKNTEQPEAEEETETEEE